jgi:hypothetical protein
MERPLARLLERSVGLNCGSPVAIPAAAVELVGRCGAPGRELLDVWGVQDGFLAFDGALVLRPCSDGAGVLDVVRWNEPGLWRDAYPLSLQGVFFAEDAFGNPFGLTEQGVALLDAETAELEAFADSLEGWAERILDEPEYHTGWPLLVEWQGVHGALPLGRRLAPKRPFALGGEYVVDNLAAARDVDAMKARGRLAAQLSSLKPGERVFYELPTA